MRQPVRTAAVVVPTTGTRDLTWLEAALGRQSHPPAEIIVVDVRARLTMRGANVAWRAPDPTSP